MMEKPLVIHSDRKGETRLKIKLGSKTLVEKEQVAFPFSSLVAECGGTLGLFVGFNFLMIWDFLSYGIQKIMPHCKYNKV